MLNSMQFLILLTQMKNELMYLIVFKKNKKNKIIIHNEAVGWWCIVYNPRASEARQENCFEFKAILGYIVNSRPAQTTEHDPASKTKQNETNVLHLIKVFTKLLPSFGSYWGLPGYSSAAERLSLITVPTDIYSIGGHGKKKQ